MSAYVTPAPDSVAGYWRGRRGIGYWRGRRAPGDRRDLRDLRRLDRRLRAGDPVTPAGSPCIEQIVYDLRRLDRQRRSGPTRHSEAWLAAVLSAYDVRLQLACRCLGLPERLQPLHGVDRELERLRMEDQLRAAGVALRPGRESAG